MAKPFRLRVQEALGAALEAIVPTIPEHFVGGQQEDDWPATMAGRVFRGRIIFSDTDPLPMLSILEEPIATETDLEPESGAGGTTTYRLIVQGFVPDDGVNPTDPAQYLIADVRNKLAEMKLQERDDRGVFLFGEKAPKIDRLNWGSGVVRPPDDGVSSKAYFWLKIALTLVEDYDDSFA